MSLAASLVFGECKNATPGINVWDNRNGPGGACNTSRSLTHSLDSTKEGLPSMVPKLCSIPDCSRPHKGHGLCNMHLIRQRNTGTTDSFIRSQEDRFWEKVNKRGSVPAGRPELGRCWEWTAATNDHGYGVLRPAGQRSGPNVKAHRYSAELAGMDIDGRHVLHSCDNPPCVNPAHLRPGTDAANMADAKERDRIPLGSERANARLVESQVSEIKQRLAAGERQKDMAPDYGVCPGTIGAIARGVTWRHVTPPAARDLVACMAETLVSA